jgi:hypothetical protein
MFAVRKRIQIGLAAHKSIETTGPIYDCCELKQAAGVHPYLLTTGEA